MTDNRAVNHLNDELIRVIDRARFEYSLSYAEVVGTLEIIKIALVHEAIEDDEDE